MEFLWLVVGVLVGLVATWLYLEVRYRARLGEQEARLSETNRRIQGTLERELGAHEGTKQRLARMDDEDASNKTRIAGLQRDLEAVRQVVESVRADASEKGLEIARLQVRNEELQAALDAIHDERTHFDAVVDRARSDNRAAAEQVRAQIAALEARLVGQGEAPGEAEEGAARLADLERRLGEREATIASLEAELRALREGGREG